MKKNYFSTFATLANPLPTVVAKKTCKSKTFTWLLAMLVLLGFSDVFGQVTVTPANGTANSCKLPTDYVTLGNITITETANNNIGMAGSGTTYSLVLNAPPNFEFNPGVGSVAINGGTGDIDIVNITVTAASITVSFSSTEGNRTNDPDFIRISGIQFRGITTPSTGNITRPVIGGGNAVIAGITAAVTNFGTLTSSNTPPTAIGGGAPTVCTGASTPAFTNAIPGGTWSITAGTGTASITAGGVVTGLTAGTVTVVYTIGTCTPATQTLTIQQTPGAIGGGSATVCTGVSTPAFTNPNAGGTWSVVAGTGTASITAGGVLTGLTAGSVTVRYTIGSCTPATFAVTVQQTPGAIAGGAANVCVGASTPAFTNPNAGGTWSVVAGTGTASITAGGILTGLTPGTVTVRYTIGSCVPATYNVNVNTTPTAIGGGATTVCTGATTPAFTNAIGGGTWSITNGTGSATVSAGGVVTGVTAGSATIVYSIGTCSVSTPITIITTPTITTNPTSVSVAVGANTSFTVAGSNSPTSYTWQVSTNGGATWTTVTNGGVYSNATTATLNITGVTMGMDGYLYHASATNSCGTSTYSTSAILNISLTYCPSVPNTNFPDGITRVQFNTINNVTATTATIPYTDYTATQNTTVTQGQTHNINVYVNTDGNFTMVQMVWFDWNRDGDFDDAGEAYNLGSVTNNANGLSSACPFPILIPVNSAVGVTRMRVSTRYSAAATPCLNGQDGEVEDYSVTILAAPPCTEPTAQPTALVLTAGTPSGTALNGSFTAASPAPQNYLVVMNTTGTAPTSLIMDGTTYPIGSSIGVGNTVVDTDSNTTFTATGLNPSTTYYFYIYSLNALCSGGPLYNTNPTVLIGNATTSTGTPTYCTPVTTLGQNDNKYINRVAFIGTLVETNNTSTYSNVTPGYQDFTGLAAKAQQAQGEGVNLIVESTGGRVRLIAWVDWNKNGTYEASEMVYGPPAAGISSTFGFVIPTGATPGDYRIRVRTFNSFYNDGNGANGNPDEYFGLNFDACQLFSTGTVSGFTSTQYGEAEDYLFTVIQRCDANITSVVDGDVCNSGVVDLIANGTAGTTQIRWYAAATGGAVLGTSTSGSTWETPSISTTTTYYCTAWNGTCESFVRTPVVARVNPTPTLTFTQSAPDVCGEDAIVALTAGGDKELTNLLYERFEGGGLGAFTNVNSDATIAATKADTRWSVKPSTFVPTAGMSWKPAISSGLAPNSFALATSDAGTPAYELVENSLESGVLNSTNYLNLTMTMKFYYSRYYPDNTNNTDEFVSIQISTNGGGAWTTLQTFTADTGIGTKFVDLSYGLNAYINQANLKVRILHHSLGSATGWLPDGVAVDDIKIFGEVPLNTAFVWSGASLPDVYTDAGATVPYVAGTPVVNVYVKPTLAQLEMGSYTFTATAVLSNGCTASQNITILNKSKIWKGTINNDWSNANNWEPIGVPDANSCVIVPSILSSGGNKSEIIGPGFNGFGKTLVVKDDGVLEVNSINTLTITDYVKVAPSGTFLIEDGSSLIQINNVANTGNIRMQRNTNIRKLDYVYWSSPVAGFSSSAISPLTPVSFIYKWAPTTATAYASQFGNWVAGSESMTTGRGYIVRGPDNFTTTKQMYQANFIGVPNNGIITTPISRSTYTGANYIGPTSTQVTANDDNWNLIGNPFPSAVSADAFLAANSAKISGFVKIWTHGALPSAATADPFYQDFVINYTVADYITHNALGGTQPGFDGFIPAGQGFFVLMQDAAATPNTVEFNNTMRSRTYRNDQFFRAGSNEKHRIWLQLVSPQGAESKSLVGYTTEATNGIDHLYDAINVGVKTNFEIYSVAENNGLSIQGRSLPFDNNDRVNLGVTIPQNGNYTLAIAAVDGLFDSTAQNIYLEDTALGITHDLRAAPYTFTGTVGTNETRFVLKFNNSTLSNEDFTANAVTVYTNESINITTANLTIKSVRVHDLLGKVIGTFNNVNAETFSTRNVAKTQSPLLVEVTLENGATKTYKVIF